MRLLYLVVLLFAPAYGQAHGDDDSEPTIVETCYGALPDECGSPKQAVIPAGGGIHDAIVVDDSRSTFRHTRWVSGPPACLLTSLETKDGGRNCGPSSPRCGYYAEGYTIYGISGLACTGAGVSECQGPFCY